MYSYWCCHQRQERTLVYHTFFSQKAKTQSRYFMKSHSKKLYGTKYGSIGIRLCDVLFSFWMRSNSVKMVYMVYEWLIGYTEIQIILCHGSNGNLQEWNNILECILVAWELLIWLPEWKKSQEYLNKLDSQLVRFAVNYIPDTWMYQQSNALKHVSAKMMKKFFDIDVCILKWHSSFLGLNQGKRLEWLFQTVSFNKDSLYLPLSSRRAI